MTHSAQRTRLLGISVVGGAGHLRPQGHYLPSSGAEIELLASAVCALSSSQMPNRSAATVPDLSPDRAEAGGLLVGTSANEGKMGLGEISPLGQAPFPDAWAYGR